jgi:GGDEF domain-containing protein
MKASAPMESVDLERREFQLSLFACSAIVILAAGLAVFMYPAVFSKRELSPNRTLQVAFFGFCILSCLLVAYIVNRQITIQALRHQITIDRKRASEALNQASADLLEAMPNFNTFEDELSMEFRRAAAAKLTLSVLVVTIKLCAALTESNLGRSVLGDAVKAISRKLREQDSIYLLQSGFFGIILPGVDRSAVQQVSAHLTEGLSDAAGANARFSFKIDAISYPEQTTSAFDMELAVCELLPEDDPKQTMIKKTHA